MLLYYSLFFLVIAIVAALLGFTGIAVSAAVIARVLFGIFLVIFIITFILWLLGKPTVVVTFDTRPFMAFASAWLAPRAGAVT